jgi:hypothetical protein
MLTTQAYQLAVDFMDTMVPRRLVPFHCPPAIWVRFPTQPDLIAVVDERRSDSSHEECHGNQHAIHLTFESREDARCVVVTQQIEHEWGSVAMTVAQGVHFESEVFGVEDVSGTIA